MTLCHARTVRRLQVSGTGWIPPSPFVQFKLYQGEVFQYKPGASDPVPGTNHWIDLYQGLGGIHLSETPESALQSERGFCFQDKVQEEGRVVSGAAGLASVQPLFPRWTPGTSRRIRLGAPVFSRRWPDCQMPSGVSAALRLWFA